MCYYDGRHFHNGSPTPWVSSRKQGMRAGEPFGLLLRRGSPSVHIKGRQVGVMCTGLSGSLVWAADLLYNGHSGSSVRIARKAEEEERIRRRTGCASCMLKIEESCGCVVCLCSGCGCRLCGWRQCGEWK